MSVISSNSFSSVTRYPRARFRAGFTLVEMVTVTAIFVIMTGVVLTNLPDFRNRTSLELVAQEVALVVRQAQSFGANTRAAVSSGSTAAFPSYGIWFNIDNDEAIEPSTNSFILFADSSSGSGGTPGTFDHSGLDCGTSGSECRERFSLPGGLTIADIRLCGGDTCSNNISPLNILFRRPNPEANFTDGEGEGIECGSSSCSYAIITLHSARNNQTREICVWNTGHVYTKLACP